MKNTLLLLCIILAPACYAQMSIPTTGASQAYIAVDEKPAPGFDLNNYLSENLKYPPEARQKKIQGRVVVKFVVNEDGSISDAQALRGIGGGCDEEAIRVINAMPKWISGKQKGKLVKVYFTQPITFRLD